MNNQTYAAFSDELQKIAGEVKNDAELKELGRQRAVTTMASESYREQHRRGERAGNAVGRTGGAVAGAVAGKKYMGGRLGAIAGGGLGYLAGGHVGREVGTEVDIKKNASAEKKPPTVMGTMVRSLGGMALGTAGGYGAAKGLEHVGKRLGHDVSRFVPLVAAGAGAGLTALYPYMKAQEAKELQDAVEHKRKSR